MECALVRRPFTGYGDRDPVGSGALEGERLPECRGQTLGDDPGAGEVRIGVKEVHVPAAAPPQPGLPSEDLRGHLAHVHPVRDGQVVRAVRGGHGIAPGQVCTDPRGDRFLACGQVHFAGDQPGADVEARGLVGVVFAQDPFLKGADQHHHAQ